MSDFCSLTEHLRERAKNKKPHKKSIDVKRKKSLSFATEWRRVHAHVSKEKNKIAMSRVDVECSGDTE